MNEQTILPIAAPTSLPAEVSFPLIANTVLDAFRVIILDDDPTGAQTVYDVPILTSWDIPTLQHYYANHPLFFLMTNSRSLPSDEANQLAFDIGASLKEIVNEGSYTPIFVSRGDSTLRGHYPGEVDALADGLGWGSALQILIPAFMEGGRYTLHGIHYVKEGETWIPAAQTPFAADKSFSLGNSFLPAWVEEKTGGRVKEEDVLSISLEALRSEPVGETRNRITPVTETIQNAPDGSVLVVDACSYNDLRAFFHAYLESGRKAIFRTAASFVTVLHNKPPKPLLGRMDIEQPGGKGGIVLAGSYVPKTTAQLSYLRSRFSFDAEIEIDVNTLLDSTERMEMLEKVSRRLQEVLAQDGDVLIFTSRQLVATKGQAANLAIGQTVSDFLVALVASIKVMPRYIITKGGITSSDVATRALGMEKARVVGQILPGVPVWEAAEGSVFPGLRQVIFPGNVGGEDALWEAVCKITKA